MKPFALGRGPYTPDVDPQRFQIMFRKISGVGASGVSLMGKCMLSWFRVSPILSNKKSRARAH